MHCPECDGEITGTEKFCPHCGAAVAPRDTSLSDGGTQADSGTHGTGPGPDGSLSDGDTQTDTGGGPAGGAATDRYDILGEIGGGNMGTVYRACNKMLPDRVVALKRLIDKGEASRRAIERFMTEASAIGTLSHFNIVQIYDIGRDGEGPFIVMEYVDGGTLADLITGEAPLSLDRAVDIAGQLCDALQAAHEQGVIHRDLKPANVLMTSRGTPKIADFGLARMEGRRVGTQTGAVLGTPDYMAPEQEVNPAGADARADIYALGAILYEMVTGQRPRTIRESALPSELREIVLRAVEEHPDKRYQTVAALGQALADVPAGGGYGLEGGQCPKCGAANPLDAKFCSKCRQSLVVTCHQCGAETPRGATYCQACGLDLPAYAREKWEDIRDHQARGEALRREQKYNEALAEFGAILKETHPDFHSAAERAQQAVDDILEEQAAAKDERKQYADAVTSLIDEKRYGEALDLIDTMPAHLRDVDLEKQIEELQQLQTQVADLRERAEDELRLRDTSAALAAVDALLEVAPPTHEVLDLVRRVEREHLRAEHVRAIELAKRGDDDGAAAIWQAFLDREWHRDDVPSAVIEKHLAEIEARRAAARAEVVQAAKRKERLLTAGKVTGYCVAGLFLIWLARGCLRGCGCVPKPKPKSAPPAITAIDPDTPTVGTAKAPPAEPDSMLINVTELGFTSAVSMDFGESLEVAVARGVLAERFGNVTDAGYGVFVYGVGPGSECVWVRPTGRIIAASKGEMTDHVTFQRLCYSCLAVARTLRGEHGPASGDSFQARFQKTAQFFASKSGQYQRLWVRLPQAFDGWTLSWPDGEVAWARLLRAKQQGLVAPLHVDNRALTSGDVAYGCEDLSYLQFGDHALRYRSGYHLPVGWAVFHACFRDRADSIGLQTHGASPLDLTRTASRAVSILRLPRPGPRLAEAPRGRASRDSAVVALGFRSAVSAEIGLGLREGPTRKALETAFGEVMDIRGALLVPKAGDNGRAVWVYRTGRIVVADVEPVRARNQVLRLQQVWGAVAGTVAKITAGVEPEEVLQRYHRTAVYFTEGPNQLQRLLVDGAALGHGPWHGWGTYCVLDCPDAPAAWGRVGLLTPGVHIKASIGKWALEKDARRSVGLAPPGRSRDPFHDGRLPGPRRQRTGQKWADFDDLQPGQQAAYGASQYNQGAVVFEAFFPSPAGRMALYDMAAEPRATSEFQSRAISELLLPWPPDRSTATTRGEAPPSSAPGPAVSKRPVGQTAAELGFRAALEVKMGGALKKAPVKKALEAQFGDICETRDILIVPKAGPRSEVVWVYPDGRLVAASKRSLSADKDLSALHLALASVAERAAGVTAGISQDGLDRRFLETVRFFTVEPDQYQRLYIRALPKTFEWILSWPDARPTWARYVEAGGPRYRSSVHLAERKIGETCEQPMAAGLQRLPFGEHVLKGTDEQVYGHEGRWMVIESFYEKPNGKIALYDKANRPVTTRAVHSLALASLRLPWPKPMAAPTPTPGPTPDPRPGLPPRPEPPDRDAQLQSWYTMAEQYLALGNAKGCRKAEEFCRKVLDAKPKDVVLATKAQRLMERIERRKQELGVE